MKYLLSYNPTNGSSSISYLKNMHYWIANKKLTKTCSLKEIRFFKSLTQIDFINVKPTLFNIINIDC